MAIRRNRTSIRPAIKLALHELGAARELLPNPMTFQVTKTTTPRKLSLSALYKSTAQLNYSVVVQRTPLVVATGVFVSGRVIISNRACTPAPLQALTIRFIGSTAPDLQALCPAWAIPAAKSKKLAGKLACVFTTLMYPAQANAVRSITAIAVVAAAPAAAAAAALAAAAARNVTTPKNTTVAPCNLAAAAAGSYNASSKVLWPAAIARAGVEQKCVRLFDSVMVAADAYNSTALSFAPPPGVTTLLPSKVFGKVPRGGRVCLKSLNRKGRTAFNFTATIGPVTATGCKKRMQVFNTAMVLSTANLPRRSLPGMSLAEREARRLRVTSTSVVSVPVDIPDCPYA